MLMVCEAFRWRRTQDKGDGNLLSIFIEVHGKFLEQPLLMFQEDDPAAGNNRTSKRN